MTADAAGGPADGTPPITVLVVDDHPVVRDGLVGMLSGQPDLEVVGEAGNGHEALLHAERLDPDVILMDLRMPELDGVSAIEALVARGQRAAVLVLTTFDRDEDIVPAVEAGAMGYLLKDTPREELFRAVRAVHRGESVLAPSVATKLLSRVRDAPPSLSPRELEVLALAARGATNREIGRAIHVSEATVKTHLLRAYEKLDVNDRTAAVVTAIQRGLLDLDATGDA